VKAVFVAALNEFFKPVLSTNFRQDIVIKRIARIKTSLMVTAKMRHIEPKNVPALLRIPVECVKIRPGYSALLVKEKEKLDETPKAPDKPGALGRPVPLLHKLAVKICSPVPSSPEIAQGELLALPVLSLPQKRYGLKKKLQSAPERPSAEHSPAEFQVFTRQIKPLAGSKKEHEGKGLIGINIFKVRPRRIGWIRPSFPADKGEDQLSFFPGKTSKPRKNRELNSFNDFFPTQMADPVSKAEAVLAGRNRKLKPHGEGYYFGFRPLVNEKKCPTFLPPDLLRPHALAFKIKAASCIQAEGKAQNFL